MTRQAAKDFYEPQGGETVGYISALDAQSAIDVTYNDFESADSGKVAKSGDTMTGVLGVYELDGGGYDITVSNAPNVDITDNLLVGSLNGSNGVIYVDNISPNNAGELKIGADTAMTGALAVVTSESDGITVDPVDPNSSIGGGVRITGKEARFTMDRPSDPNNSNTVEFLVDGTRRAAINVNNSGLSLYCNGNAGELGGLIGAQPTAVASANISTNVGGAYLRAKDVLLQGESVRLKALSNATWSPVNSDDVVNKGYVDQRVAGGRILIQTDGSGNFTIATGLSQQATWCHVQCSNNPAKAITINAYPNSTNLICKAYDSSGNGFSVNAVWSWVAGVV